MGMDATDLAHGLFRVLETGDPALAAEVVHEDFHNREAAVSPAACALPGPAGVLASGAWMRFAFSDLTFPVLGIARNDEQVWVRLRMQGRHTGPFVRFRDGALDQAIPPTGRDIDFEQIHVLELRDGKVVGHEAVRDDITMLGQLGVFPPAPATALRMVAWRVTGRATRAATDVTAQAVEAAGRLQDRGPSH
ncbi:SnoaL-like polyketide cyclase [Streptomyces sp. Ag82_O1-15]|jgi:predicted ester cyclase|uniref:ester cyclase n=1 Tax=Streptomyces sp. Ag82_O1-15 TaxID=1938855 RepID=UPI000BB0DC8E|nr:ester cyclase [Streptomyces sp. Ag82_O1-15]PBD01852.1 SnoaL-like polyketide cyclase [Streptomyces sp. Ag82_O1-15]